MESARRSLRIGPALVKRNVDTRPTRYAMEAEEEGSTMGNLLSMSDFFLGEGHILQALACLEASLRM